MVASSPSMPYAPRGVIAVNYVAKSSFSSAALVMAQSSTPQTWCRATPPCRGSHSIKLNISVDQAGGNIYLLLVHKPLVFRHGGNFLKRFAFT